MIISSSMWLCWIHDTRFWVDSLGELSCFGDIGLTCQTLCQFWGDTFGELKLEFLVIKGIHVSKFPSAKCATHLQLYNLPSHVPTLIFIGCVMPVYCFYEAPYQLGHIDF